MKYKIVKKIKTILLCVFVSFIYVGIITFTKPEWMKKGGK